MLGRTLVRGLREAGFEVEIAPTGEAGLSALAERPADAMILDVVLPGIDGFETCRRLRAGDSRTSVVMLSARGGVADRGTRGGIDLQRPDADGLSLPALVAAHLRADPRDEF